MLHLKINDDDLFKDAFPDGQCTRTNRIDPNDIKLTFALCNNLELESKRAVIIAQAALAIAKATLEVSMVIQRRPHCSPT
jgi:type IV secretion system protein VirB6